MKNRVRAGLALGAAGAIVFASAPAYAQPMDDRVYSAHASWRTHPTTPVVIDAQSAARNALGTGVDLEMGWTTDAFDSVFEYVYVDGELVAWNLQGGGAGAVDSGFSSFRFAGITADAEIEALLEIQGNYARWTFTRTDTANGTLELEGNHGSDRNETVVAVSPNSAVVFSDDLKGDPVIGYQLVAEGGTITAESGDDDIAIRASLSSPVVVVAAVQDYAPCVQQDVVGQMIDRVTTLNAEFGQDLPGLYECAALTAPSALSVGSETLQTLTFEINDDVDELLADLPNRSGRDPYLSDLSVLRHAFVGVPDGLTMTFSPDDRTVTVAGTPTAAGVFEVALLTYLTDARDYLDYRREDLVNGYPLTATISITVVGPQLAESGLDASSGWLAALGAALVLGGALLTRSTRSPQH